MSEEPQPGDDETTFDWLTLDDDEQVIWTGQPHAYSLVPALVVGIPLSLVLVGIPIVLGAYLGRENTVYLLTNEGLYQKSGILSRDVQKIEFEKVQNTAFSQGPLGNAVGYGNVDISTAGGDSVEMRFRAVPDPKDVQARIKQEIRKTRSGNRENGDSSTRSSEDVLDEILTELREIRSHLENGTGDVESERESPADRR